MSDFHARPVLHQLAILQELAEAATALYDLPFRLAVKLVNVSENATYKVSAADGRSWALRIHREGYHSRTAIASELAWLIDLRNSGVALTPIPVPGKDGDFIQAKRHPVMTEPRHIVLTQWEQGSEPVIEGKLSAAFEALGEVTAGMHAHARAWRKPAWFTRFRWDVETALGDRKPHWGRWRSGLGMTAEIEVVFERTVNVIRRRLAAYGTAQHRFGLVHGDLRLANLLVDGATIKVIDFDDCGFSWFLYDAATPVSFHEHKPQVPDLIDSWITGYRRVALLSKDDAAEIPTFVMLRRLLLVAWVGSHHQTDLAKSLGQGFTEDTIPLCDSYLSKFDM
jgi:Ser/Thr protein kinase RdoA (MazF antagonist)